MPDNFSDLMSDMAEQRDAEKKKSGQVHHDVTAQAVDLEAGYHHINATEVMEQQRERDKVLAPLSGSTMVAGQLAGMDTTPPSGSTMSGGDTAGATYRAIADQRPEWVEGGEGAMRSFDTGATRDTDAGKPDYEGFLSPLVIERYGEYMNQHRTQSDGALRDSDNWQKGIPMDAYMKSGWRHFFDWWKIHRSTTTAELLEEALCALMFNVMGYLHEHLSEKRRDA